MGRKKQFEEVSGKIMSLKKIRKTFQGTNIFHGLNIPFQLIQSGLQFLIVSLSAFLKGDYFKNH